MKRLRHIAARLAHEEIQGEFAQLTRLDDRALEAFKTEHLARRQPPSGTTNLSVAMALAVFGIPWSLVNGLLSGEAAYFFSALLWAAAATGLYFYLARAARYWRERAAIRREEISRFGHASFG
jgi:hypothetical protein